MDYFTLKQHVTWLNVVLSGACIQSCYQRQNKTLEFSVMIKGRTAPDPLLICDCSTSDTGLYLSDRYTARKNDSLLARSFRNKMSGAQIQCVEMPYPDRIVILHLDLPEWQTDRELWVEFCGFRSNVSLVDLQNRLILECLTKFPDDTRDHPIRMPGRLFESRWDRISQSVRHLRNLPASTDWWPESADPDVVASELRNSWVPMTPTLSDELARLKCKSDIQAANDRIRSALIQDNPPNSSFDVSLQSLLHYRHSLENTIQAGQLLMKKNNLLKAVSKALSRCRTQLKSLDTDYAGIPDPDSIREKADLLAINFDSIRYGMVSIDVENVFMPGTERLAIELNPEKSPKENLALWFKKAAKARRAGPAIKQRMELVRNEQARLTELKESIELAMSLESLDLISSQLHDAGFLSTRTSGSYTGLKLTEKPYIRVVSSDGWSIWIGRNAHENDMLSFKDGDPQDFWLHAKNSRGAHVIVKNQQKCASPPESTLIYAAHLAAHFSKARGEKAVTVIFTKRKYIRRVPGNRPGLVRVAHHDTVIVDASQPPPLNKKHRPR